MAVLQPALTLETDISSMQASGKVISCQSLLSRMLIDGRSSFLRAVALNNAENAFSGRQVCRFDFQQASTNQIDRNSAVGL